jgi:hypothetical protein
VGFLFDASGIRHPASGRVGGRDADGPAGGYGAADRRKLLIKRIRIIPKKVSCPTRPSGYQIPDPGSRIPDPPSRP